MLSIRNTLGRWTAVPLAVILLISLVSCLDQSGENGSAGATDVSSIPPISNDSASPYVCSALSNAAAATSNDATMGLIANLFYLDPSQPRYANVNDMINFGIPVSNVSLFFNEVNIPTRSFSEGFATSDGTVLTNNQGNTLYEYFALDFQSDIVLSNSDLDGDYQFALLADDGAVLATRDSMGNPVSTIVDDNGTHPTAMGCSTAPITMDHNSRLPIDLRYYQGPRYNIALVVMFRPWPSDPAQVVDPQCGRSGNYQFFNWSVTPAAPQQAFLDLLSRGWKVMAPGNFKVPEGITNSCNSVPAPVISNITVAATSSTTATITWTTDVASTSQVQITNGGTGVVTSTAVNSTTVTSHSVTVTGLSASTLYSASVISASVSGNSTTGAAVGFRTTR